MNKSESIGKLAAALCEAQSEFPIVLRDKVNPFFSSKYADLQSVRNAIRPVLLKHGLSYVQLPGGDGRKMVLQTVLLHSSGEWIADDGFAVLIEPKTDKGGKAISDPQGVAAAITYARRYGLTAMLGVVADDDDDGEAAAGRKGRPGASAPMRGSVSDDAAAEPKQQPERQQQSATTDATKEQIDLASALAGACTKGFAAVPHKDNWKKKHIEEIKTLPEWLRARVRAAYDAAPIHAAQGAAQ